MSIAFNKFLDPVSYSKNVVKSAGYIGKSVIKGLNPTLTRYVETNVSSVKDLWDSMKSKTKDPKKQINEFFEDNEYGKMGKEFVGNILHDLKTGEFYNSERAEKNTKESMKDMFGLDFDEDFFGDDDFDDNKSSSNSNSQGVTKSTILGVGADLASSNRRTVETSMSRLMRMSRSNTRAMMAQNMQMMSSINRSVNSVNGTMLMIYQNMSKPLTDHITNSTKFYTTATEQLSLQTGYIKEIRDILVKRFEPKRRGWNKKESTWEKVFGYNGTDLPNLVEVAKGWKKNAMESSLGLMASMLDPGMLKGAIKSSDMYSNPIAALITMASTAAFNRTGFGKGLNRTVSALPGFFAAGMNRANQWGRKRGDLLGTAIELLTGGLVPKVKNKFDLSKYNKGRTDWTGKDDKALREVIPTQLALILSALTGNDPKIFNYETGRWEKATSVMEKFEKARRDNIKYSDNLRYDLAGRISDRYNISSGSNAMTSIISDYDNLIQLIATDKKADPSNKNQLRRYLKSKGYMGPARDRKKYIIHEENFDLIFDTLEERGYSDYRARFVSTAWNARSANTNFMNELSTEDKNGFGMVRNGSDLYSGKSSKNISNFNKGLGLFGKDDKGHNIFFYLQNYYSDIKRIAHYIETGSVGRITASTVGKSKRKALNAFDVPVAVNQQERALASSYDDIAVNGFIRHSAYYDKDSLRGLQSKNWRSSWNADELKKSREDKLYYLKNYKGKNLGPRPKDDALGGLVWDVKKFFSNNMNGERNTMFDTINNSISKAIFGDNPEKKDIAGGLVGAIHDLPNALEKIMNNVMRDTFKWMNELDSIKDLKGKIKNKWNEFKKSDAVSEFISTFKGAGQYYKDSFSDIYKGIKNSPFAATIMGKNDVNTTGSNYRGGQVIKSGVASVSEGEMIIPAHLNPFYRKFIPDSTRKKIEERNTAGWLNSSMSDDYDFYGNFRKGSTGKYHSKKKGKKQPRSATFRTAQAGARFARWGFNKAKDAATQEAEALGEDIKDAIEGNETAKDAVNSFKQAATAFKNTSSRLAHWVDDALGEDEEYRKLREKAKNFGFLKMAKKHKGAMAAGGLIGGSIGAILTGGNQFGFLGGSVIGSLASLTMKSEEFSEKMFGTYDDKTDSYSGGLLGKNLSNFIKKRFPNMAKSGLVGATIASLIKGPQGVVGGLAIGAGLNLLAGSFDVNNILLGPEGVDGKRRGGLAGMLKLRVIDPLVDYVHNGLAHLTSYIKKWVLDPLKNLFTPVKDWTKGIFTKVAGALFEGIHTKVFPIITERLDRWFKPLTGAVGKVGGFLGGVAKGVGTLPGRLVNTAAKGWNRHNVAMGYSTLSPEERVKIGESYLRSKAARGIRSLFGGGEGPGSPFSSGILGALSRATRVRVQNDEYNRFAASKDVTAQDLQDILDISQTPKQFKSLQNKRKQDLYEKLAGTMVNGGLNNSKDLSDLRGILNNKEVMSGDKKSRVKAIDKWLTDQVKKGTIDRSNLEAARDAIGKSVTETMSAEDAFKNATQRQADIEAKWKGRFKFSDLKGFNARRILASDIAFKKGDEEYKKAYDDSDEAKKKRYEEKLNKMTEENPVDNEKIEYLKNISQNAQIIASNMTGKSVDKSTSDSDAKNIVDSVMKGSKEVGAENTDDNKNEQNETEKVVKGEFHKAGDNKEETITEITETGVVKYTKNANGDMKPDMRDSETKENYENNKAEQKAKIGFFNKMLGNRKEGGGFLDKLQGFLGINGKDNKKEKKKSIWETIMGWGSTLLGAIGNVFGTVKSFFSDAVGALTTIAGFGTSITAIGALATYLKGFFGTKGDVFNKLEGGSAAYNNVEAKLLGDKRVKYDKTDVNGNKEFQDPRGLSRIASHTFWSGMVAGGVPKLLPGIIGKGVTVASKAGFKATELGVETAAEVGTRVAPKAATFFANVGSKVANTKVGAMVARSAESGLLAKISGGIKAIISKVAVLLGKNGAQAAEAAAGVTEQASGAVAQYGRTHGGASLLSKIAGPLRIAQILLAVENGFEDAQANLGILDPPTLPQRAVSAIVAGISDLMFGLIPTATLLNFGIAIGNALGLDLSGLNEQRAAAKAEMDEWNATNPDQQYNNVREYLKNRYGLYTTQDKIARVAKKVGGAAWGAVKTVGRGAWSGVKTLAKGAVTAGKGIFTAGKELYNLNKAQTQIGGKALSTVLSLSKNQNRFMLDAGKLVGSKAIEGAKKLYGKATTFKDNIINRATNYLKEKHGDKLKALGRDSNFMMVGTFGKNLADAFKTQDPIKGTIDAFSQLIGKPSDMDVKGSLRRIADSIVKTSSTNKKGKGSSMEDASKELDKETGLAKPNTLFGLLGNAVEKLLKLATYPLVVVLKGAMSIGDKIRGITDKFIGPIKELAKNFGVGGGEDSKSSDSDSSTSGKVSPIDWFKGLIKKAAPKFDIFSKGKEEESGSGSHISQIYNDVASRKFGGSNVANEGCGPAVATSVLRRFGKNAKLRDSVEYAIKRGYAAGASGIGTNAGFFGDILGRNGINTEYTESKSNINNSIKNGLPTILLGKNSSNRSKMNSPFGPRNHYVVAQGMDRKGNVIVDDPELNGTALYNKSILKDVKMGVTTGGDSGMPLFPIQSGFQSSIQKNNVANINTSKDKQSKQKTDSNSSVLNDDYLGKYVKKFESGEKGPEVISSGTGDHGGVSYGTYQLASFAQDGGTAKKGLLTSFWDKYYAQKHPGLTVANTPEFKNAWLSEVNANKDQFTTNEHTFIADNFYTPSTNKLKSLGFDVDNYDRGVQEAVWSSAVQYGPGPLLTKMFTNSGVNTSMTPTEFIDKLYGYKINNVSSNFKSSSQAVRNSITTRYGNERDIVKGLAGQKPISPYAVGIPGVSIPSSNLPAGATATNGAIGSSGTSIDDSSNTDTSLTGIINGIFGGLRNAIKDNLSGVHKGLFSTIFGLSDDTASTGSTGSDGSTGSSSSTNGVNTSSFTPVNIDVKNVPNFGFTTLQEFYNLLMSTVGYLEKASRADLGDFTDSGKRANAGSGNYTIYWDWYKKLGYGDLQGQPYCAGYISTMMAAAFGIDKARNLLCGDLFTYCPTGYTQFKSQNRIFDTPAPFDVVFFWHAKQNRWGHTGYVVDVDSDGKGYTTIEANTSSGDNNVERNGGATCKKHYSMGSAKVAFGRPDYAGNGISATKSGSTSASTSTGFTSGKTIRQNLAANQDVKAKVFGSGSGLLDFTKKYNGGDSGLKQNVFSMIDKMNHTKQNGSGSGVKPSTFSRINTINNRFNGSLQECTDTNKQAGRSGIVPIYDFTKKYRGGDSGLASTITNEYGKPYYSSGSETSTNEIMVRITQLLGTIAQNTTNNNLLAPILEVLQKTMGVMATMNSSNASTDSETKDKINMQLYNMMNKLDAISKAV